MMKFKAKALFAAAMMCALVAVGCNENTDDPITGAPSAPTGLMANSKDFETVRLKWTASTSATAADFSNYVLTVTPDGGTAMADMTVPKGATTFEVSGLTEGTVYTFSLKSKSTASTNNMSSAATVKWSPATRYTGVKIYETASDDFGSGLDLDKDGTTGSDYEVLKVAGAARWDIALDTRAFVPVAGGATVTSYDIGSPTLSSYAGTSKVTLVSDKRYEGVASLDDVFDTQALGQGAAMAPTVPQLVTFFRDKAYTLNGITFPTVNATQNFVFFAKTAEGNIAKILVKGGANGVLQGTAPNRYVEMDISYQSAAGVPYAFTANGKGGSQQSFKAVANSSSKKIAE